MNKEPEPLPSEDTVLLSRERYEDEKRTMFNLGRDFAIRKIAKHLDVEFKKVESWISES